MWRWGVVMIGLSGCLSAGPQSLFSSRVEKVVLEVDYYPSAVPTLPRNSEGWPHVERNLRGLFAPMTVEVVVPTRRDQMESLTPTTLRLWDREALLSVSEFSRNIPWTRETASYHVLFVPGYYHEDGEVKAGVLGVSLGASSVIAVFPAAMNALRLDPARRELLEQTTLLHELGHGFGLVDNGLEPVTEHQQEGLGAHCDNPDCVMYWANDGVADLMNFLEASMEGETPMMFGPACLEDINAAIEEGRRGPH